MKGWKTIFGSVVTFIGASYGMYNGTIDVASGLQAIGAAAMGLGLGHKLDRLNG